jgi:hypothetical protein
MSTEQVLLLLAVLVLTLFQAMRAARAQRESEPSSVEGPPPSPDPPQLLELQPLPVAADGGLSEAISRPGREPARKAGARKKLTMVRSARPGAATLALRRPADLRRAIVLKTVLEPCRAIQPYD